MKLITKTFLCFVLFFPVLSFANIIFVNHAAQGLNNGTNWQNAFVDLQDALNSFPAPDTIWLAEGTYYPTDGTDRNISFEIPNGVAIFGGFEGNETQLSQRDWEANPTILSGDIGEQNNNSDNSFSILYATMTDTTTTIDGLIIKYGNANSDIPVDPSYGRTKSGGGLFLDGQGSGNETSIKINNCKFLENYAVGNGGAVFCSGQNGSVSFIISNTIFENNETESSGGAIGKTGGCNTVQNLLSCKFENNRTGNYGGAYWSNDSNVIIDLNIEDCDFINNEAAVGGAISRATFFVTSNNDLNISDCLFEGNESLSFGGAIYDSFSSFGDIYINNCDFVKNVSTTSSNGAISAETLVTNSQSNLVISHCNFIENICDKFGGAIGTNLNLYSINNLFYKNKSLDASGGCIAAGRTEIINNTFFKNTVANGEGAVFRGGGEIKVLNSIFWENEANLIGGITGGIFSITADANLNIGTSFFDVEVCDSIIYQDPFGNIGEIICQSDVLFNINPLFRDTANMDFALQACSPAVNAGQTAIIDSLGILEDLAGNDRVIDGIVDIGAFEQEGFSANLESIQHESCFGNSNGAIYFNTSGIPPFEISWQSGNESGTNTTGLSPGVYDFTIIDADGCSDTLTIEIEAATGLTTNFESNDASGADVADGSIDFEVISGGTPGYTYEWNTGETTASISGLLPGNYFLTVTDAIFCKYGFAFSVGITTGIEELEAGNNFQIYPNPAGDFINIEIEIPVSEIHRFQLFDELGRLVLEKEFPMLQNSFQVSLEAIHSGFYHYCIVNDEALVKTGKLVVFKN
jgi:predicted outer membrane repeat protein